MSKTLKYSLIIGGSIAIVLGVVFLSKAGIKEVKAIPTNIPDYKKFLADKSSGVKSQSATEDNNANRRNFKITE